MPQIIIKIMMILMIKIMIKNVSINHNDYDDFDDYDNDAIVDDIELAWVREHHWEAKRQAQ